jgi:hypothetical protein
MLAGTVRAGGRALNVRILDFSAMGALLETNTPPEEGSRVTLVRGEEHIDAKVVWTRQTCFGVRFSEFCDVAAWTGSRIADLSGKSDAPFTARPTRDGDDLQNIVVGRVGEELAFVSRLIETIGNELVGSPLIVQRYATTLQGVDLASQLLGHLARVLMAEDRPGAAGRISLECLRNRLLR